MPRRNGLTDKQIETLPRKAKRTIIADPELRGLYLRIPPAGTNAPITYTAVARDPHGRQIWTAIGTTADQTVDQARAKARETVRRIKAGLPPIEPPQPPPDSVAVVADNWLARVVDKERHRTSGETRRIIGKYIVPHIGGRVFAELRRSEIARLLDLIEDQHGARTADRASRPCDRSQIGFNRGMMITFRRSFAACGARRTAPASKSFQMPRFENSGAPPGSPVPARRCDYYC